MTAEYFVFVYKVTICLYKFKQVLEKNQWQTFPTTLSVMKKLILALWVFSIFYSIYPVLSRWERGQETEAKFSKFDSFILTLGNFDII